MIEIFDPDTIPVRPLAHKLGGHGWHYPLDYSWVIQQIGDFCYPGEKILDVGSLNSPMAKHLKGAGYDVTTLDKNPSGKPDIVGDFMDQDIKRGEYSMIMWLSSIEHRDTLGEIRKQFERSLDLLDPDGILLVTFGIGTRSVYKEGIGGWVISQIDAMRMFDIDTIRGKYERIWGTYRDNRYGLRDRYVARFGEWNNGSPDYLGAGLIKTKS